MRNKQNEIGAALVEQALTIALIAIVSVSALQSFERVLTIKNTYNACIVFMARMGNANPGVADICDAISVDCYESEFADAGICAPLVGP